MFLTNRGTSEYYFPYMQIRAVAHVLVFTKHSAKHFRDTKHHDASNCYNIPMFRLLSHNFLTTIWIIDDHWVGQISRKSRLKEISTEPSGAKIFSRTSTSCSQVSPYAGSQTQSEQITSRRRSVTSNHSTLNHSTSWRHLRLVLASLTISDNLWQSLSLWYLGSHLTLPVNAVWTPVKTLSRH